MADNEVVKTIAVLEQHIEALESRNAFQDDVIEQLNQEITVHQQQLSELKEQISLITSRLRDAGGSQIAKLEDETPPPHY